jgi:hypothetical protein
LREYSIFLDVAAPIPDGAYRLLQEWIWSGRTPVILLARGSTEREVGRPARLFWHSGLQMQLEPMRTEDLESLLEFTANRLGIAKNADRNFRDFVLKQCAGLPGGMVRLCELASQRAYQCEGHFKLHTLAVDFLMQENGALLDVARVSRND